MIPIKPHVDSAYLCFYLPPQAESLHSWVSARESHADRTDTTLTSSTDSKQSTRAFFYLNCTHAGDDVVLEHEQRTIWTVVPFDINSFYLEVTKHFGSAPLYLSITKGDRFVLTSFATDGVLFFQREGQYGTALMARDLSGHVHSISITERRVRGAMQLTITTAGFHEETPSFSLVHGSRDHRKVVSLEDCTYRHKCAEYFLCESPDTSVSTQDTSESNFVNTPRKALAPGATQIQEAQCCTAKTSICAGTVLCTHQDGLFRTLFLHAQVLVAAKHSVPILSVNAAVSVMILGHPLRSFPVYLIVALEGIAEGQPIVPQFAFPDTTDILREPQVKISDWPEEEPYFHGIGRHTCGAPQAAYPLHMVSIRACPQIGRGQKELIAKCAIPKGTVFPYTGALSDRTSPYSWFTSAGHNVLGGGVMRYANLYFGFSDRPNAALVDGRFALGDDAVRPILGVILLSDIAAGEPILVRSYGRDADFEVLRRHVCDGKYLALRDFPPAMRIRGLTSCDQWYLPGDIVAVRKNASGRKSADVTLYSIASIEGTTAVSVPMQRVQHDGVEFILAKGQREERLKLDKCILLIPDEDYDIIHVGKRSLAATPAGKGVDSTPYKGDYLLDAHSSHKHSWEIGKNRGPVSVDALTAATSSVELSVKSSQRRVKKRKEAPILTLHLSRAVHFLLFDEADGPHERSTEVHALPATASAPVRTPRKKTPEKRKQSSAATHRHAVSLDGEVCKGLEFLDADASGSTSGFAALNSIDMLGLV